MGGSHQAGPMVAAGVRRCFREDMKGFEQQVATLVKAPLKPHQFDAVVSFGYNVGVGNLKSSTLLRKLNIGDHDAAALEFHRWNRSKGKVLTGLVRRRAAEALLFQGTCRPCFNGNPIRCRRWQTCGNQSTTNRPSATLLLLTWRSHHSRQRDRVHCDV